MTQAYGPRHYAIDMDRPVVVEARGRNRDGATDVVLHRYLDEPGEVWRDATGRIVERSNSN